MYEDLVGGDVDDAGDDYFDGSEFAIRREIEDSHYWHVHRRRVLLKELQSFASPEHAGPMIEMGCGIGTVATHLNEHGYRVDYADVFRRAMTIAEERARKRLGDVADERKFYRIDITRPIPAKDHVGVCLFDVIEHLPDDTLVMDNVRAFLDGKEGGFVMVTVPAFQMLWSPWDDVEKHERRYTKPQLVELLQRTGFEVERVTYFFSPFFFAALGMKGFRMLRTSLGLDRPPSDITDLAESKSNGLLNATMLSVLSPERSWLKLGSLPLGTSILAIARVA